MGGRVDITGERYGFLVAIRYDHSDSHGRALWLCKCDCGNEVIRQARYLRRDRIKHCGCKNLRKKINWKGGICKTKYGYILVRLPEHPNVYSNGYVPYHRLVMEQMMGRYLLPEETVHHKNGIKDDNRPENLELWSTNHGRGVRLEDVEFEIPIIRRV